MTPKASTLEMTSSICYIELLVDKIFVVFAPKVSQQIVGIPMGRNFAPLLADIFLLK